MTFASWLDHHHQVGQPNRPARATNSCQRSSAPPTRSRNPTVAAAPMGGAAQACGDFEPGRSEMSGEEAFLLVLGDGGDCQLEASPPPV